MGVAQLLLEPRHGERDGDPGPGRPSAAAGQVVDDDVDRGEVLHDVVLEGIENERLGHGVPEVDELVRDGDLEGGRGRGSEKGKRSLVMEERRLLKLERIRIMSSATFLEVVRDLTMCCTTVRTLLPSPPVEGGSG
jgi:hypothetical protein